MSLKGQFFINKISFENWNFLYLIFFVGQLVSCLANFFENNLSCYIFGLPQRNQQKSDSQYLKCLAESYKGQSIVFYHSGESYLDK